MKISVVSTLYNSAPYIDEFMERTLAELSRAADDYEIILVDDGSPDDSLATAARWLDTEPRLRIVELSRNFGHHKAMMTGLAQASGDLVFLIDVDLEEPPELLGTFLEILRADDLDVVFGIQQSRKGGLVERVGGRVAWRFLDAMLPVRIPRNHSTARLMTREYVAALVQHGEHKTAIGGLWVLTGFAQRGVEFTKVARGKTSYDIGRRSLALLDSVTSFSERPLFLVFFLGCATLVTSVAAGVVVLVLSLRDRVLAGWPSTIVSIWFFGGLIIFCIGVVGLYISRIFIETKGRPYTVIRRTHGAHGTLHAHDGLQRAPSVPAGRSTDPGEDT